MHNERDFEEEFSKLAERLGDLSDPEIAISVLDINQVVERLNESALYLGKYVSKVIGMPNGRHDFPDELINVLPVLAMLCETTSDLIHDCVCDCGVKYGDDDDDYEDDDEEED